MLVIGAAGGTWTRTRLLPLAPQASASADSATAAYNECLIFTRQHSKPSRTCNSSWSEFTPNQECFTIISQIKNLSSAFFQKLAFLLKAAQRENIKDNLKYTICTKIQAFNCSFIQILKIFAFPIYSFEKLCYNIQRKENIAKQNVVFCRK